MADGHKTNTTRRLRITLRPSGSIQNSLSRTGSRGLAYLSTSEYDKAVADFTEAGLLDPDNADDYSLPAKQAHDLKGERDKAGGGREHGEPLRESKRGRG